MFIMKIRPEILFDKELLLSNWPITELKESIEEFMFRQEYVYDIIFGAKMLNEKIDWDTIKHSETITLLD